MNGGHNNNSLNFKQVEIEVFSNSMNRLILPNVEFMAKACMLNEDISLSQLLGIRLRNLLKHSCVIGNMLRFKKENLVLVAVVGVYVELIR